MLLSEEFESDGSGGTDASGAGLATRRGARSRSGCVSTSRWIRKFIRVRVWRRSILEAYQRWSPPDPGLAERVAWYEQIVLLRKIHGLEFDKDRRPEAELIRRRQAEAIRLLEEWPSLTESVESMNPVV